MQELKSLVKLLVLTLTLTGTTATAAPEPHSNAVIEWNAITTRLLVDPGPFFDLRPFAIVHAAMHDAVNGVERRFQPYAADLSAPGASIDAAVATAAHDVLVAFSTAHRDAVEAEYTAFLQRIPDGPAKDAGVSLGRACARANIDRRADDGIATICEPPYVPTGRPGDYAYTPPFDAPPLGPIAVFPGYGRMKPFIIDIEKHQPDGPDRLDSREYARDLNLLKSIGSVNSTQRTPEQTDIAFFWYEEPNFKWNRIANALIESHQLDEWRSARVLAQMNFAIIDSGIASMKAKYDFRFWRPYTAIRRAAEDGNAQTEPDETWQPLFSTPPSFLMPPIPDYPSGLAMLSAAAAQVLIREIGDRQHLVVTSTTLPGAIRNFDSLSDAAKECGMSRVYGGIHFLHAVEDGYRAGKSVGQAVSKALPSVRR
jgi:hypothetical protein